MDSDGRASRTQSSPGQLPSFEPARIADLESAAWAAYYQRRWLRLLVAGAGVVRAGLGMSWPRTVRAAWHALRAIQLWAPLAGNDPEGARRNMRRFYALVGAAYGQPRDPDESARLEVEWWRVHRTAQQPGLDPSGELVDALARLYAFVFGVPESGVRPAAVHRCRAMEISDRWVAQGMRPDSPLLDRQRTFLTRSYAALIAVIPR